MKHLPRLPERLAPCLFAMMVVLPTPKLFGTDLKPQTLESFTRYVELTETRVNTDLKRPGQFLFVDGLPAARRGQVLK